MKTLYPEYCGSPSGGLERPAVLVEQAPFRGRRDDAGADDVIAEAFAALAFGGIALDQRRQRWWLPKLSADLCDGEWNTVRN